MGHFAEVAGLVFWSGLKFLFGAPAALSLQYTFWDTILILITGGSLGVLAFFYGGGWIMLQVNRLVRIAKRKEREKKRFSRRNKTIVRVKTRFGLAGLAIITPCIISIPVGTLLAARYYGRDRRAVPFLLMSVVGWAFVLTTFYSFLWPALESLFK